GCRRSGGWPGPGTCPWAPWSRSPSAWERRCWAGRASGAGRPRRDRGTERPGFRTARRVGPGPARRRRRRLAFHGGRRRGGPPGAGPRRRARRRDAPGRRAAAVAGIALPAARAVVGAAGAGRAQEQAELEAALLAVGLALRVRVLADGEVALTTAFARGPGILVNAGTGSIAYARDPAGRLHRAGGYGWQLGDEGGGYWLGRRALEAAARAQDGRGEGSTLLARLLGALGLQHFDDLIRWATTATPAQVAALAPHVLN